MKELVLIIVVAVTLNYCHELSVFDIRQEIDCSKMPDGIPILIGGRGGFATATGTHHVWIESAPNLYLYSNRWGWFYVAQEEPLIPETKGGKR